MIPTPDQKKAALIVVIAYQYKSSLPNCSRLRMLRLAMRVLSIFYAVFSTRFDKTLVGPVGGLTQQFQGDVRQVRNY